MKNTVQKVKLSKKTIAHLNKLYDITQSIKFSGEEFKRARKHNNIDKIDLWRKNLKRWSYEYKTLLESEREKLKKGNVKT